jgi:hypothetical protein
LATTSISGEWPLTPGATMIAAGSDSPRSVALDRLAVDGDRQRFAHALVLERVLALDVAVLQLGAVLVERDEDGAHLVAVEDLQFGVLTQPRHVLHRQVGQHVDVARSSAATRVGSLLIGV